jgi:hypothetical protein
MTITTILFSIFNSSKWFILLSVFYKAKKQIKAEFVLALLRFLSLFGIILLLINPIITRNTLEIIKPSLAIVVDNPVR